ncbi:MAG: hypothetical protein FJ011_20325 [Chloroflexi bacterium]|nr:hypothetical protein [Chloroflexota bacterium]
MKDHLSRKLAFVWVSETGQGLVEGALTCSMLLLLILAVVDFSFIFQSYMGMVNAADAGAAYGATSVAAASNTAVIASTALSDSSNWRCTGPVVASSTATDPYGYLQVRVTVNCQVAGLIPIPGVLSNIQVSSTAVRRVQQ